MSALKTLWLYKFKGQIRNVYRKPLSAIITTLLLLFYGFIFVMMFFVDKSNFPMTNFDVHKTVLIGIGFTALLVGSVLFQKRKALFFANDAYYLFSGPFTRIQVMQFLLSQTILQALLYGFLALFMMMCLGENLHQGLFFYVMVVVVNGMTTFSFLMLCDYLYVLSITNKKYQNFSRIIVVVLITFVLILFILSLVQSQFEIATALMDFVESNLFYFVPMFGWSKLVLLAIVEDHILMMVLGLFLMLLTCWIIYFAFTRFKGDFYEQALMDSIEYTEYYEKLKQGKKESISSNYKEKGKANFYPGALSLFSKSMLVLKKSNGFVSWNELLALAIYLGVTMISNFDMDFFLYMMMFFLFSIIQNSDMNQELENYTIYLIPENPFKKLIAILLPTLIRTFGLITVAMVAAGFLFGTGLKTTLLYLIILYGYSSVFISSSVLCLKLLKSRSNKILENLVRMLVMIVCSIPGIVLTIYLIFHPQYFSLAMLDIISYSSLVLNFVVSFLILFSCRNMLNGRELNSD